MKNILVRLGKMRRRRVVTMMRPEVATKMVRMMGRHHLSTADHEDVVEGNIVKVL